MYIEWEKWKEDKRSEKKVSIDKSRREERRGKSDSVIQLDYLVFMYKRAPVPFHSWHIVKYPNSEPYPAK